MKLNISYRNINKESRKSLKKKMKEMIELHLEPYLAGFNEGQLRLHATIEHKKRDYYISLRLHVPPKKVLISKEHNENINTAINEAISELARQVERHHARVSGREQWKRKERRKRIKAMQSKISTVIPINEEKQVEDNLKPLLPRIEQYIQRELEFLQASGDLLTNYPSMEDIRDEALIQLKLDWNKLDNANDDLYQQLIKITHQIIEKEVEQTKLYANDTSLEAEPTKDAIDTAESMVEEEISEFYQPFEVLHVEDLLADENAEQPDKQIENHARSTCYQVMTYMPTNWRRIIILTHQEQLPIDYIVQHILPISLDEANNLLQQAEQFIIDSLIEKGMLNASKHSLRQLLAP